MVLPAIEYMTDAAQRTVLFWDVMRQRGNQYREHLAETAPNVLDYSVELVIDGRTLERPVNYVLVRVVPPKGVEIDMRRRPFVIVDPRAGHGPGIGGFKADSEIGVAMKAGHPCYFVGFLPDPVPGQTIEDVARAEAVFLEKVIALHPEADGKPCVIGNCQAGWAVMMLASVRPELFGPIIIAGSPLSYWNGVHGRNPMRYSGGLLGGSWLTALTSDLGNGKFDGAWLVQNFENLNPSNTLWTKQYNVYSKVDTRGDRAISDSSAGGAVTSISTPRKSSSSSMSCSSATILSPAKFKRPTARRSIFATSARRSWCSVPRATTSPRRSRRSAGSSTSTTSVDDIRSHGQTIVYSVHQKIGHLGIFVSGGVARKEHSEFSSNIDLIDVLPPGLYEATFERKGADTVNPDLAVGDWVMRCEQRTLDDIRALGGNDPADDRCFATAARVSEINLALYRTFAQPFVRALANPMMAEWMQKLHPLRHHYELFSDANPMMAMLKPMTELGARASQRRRRGQSVRRAGRRTCPSRSSQRSMPGATRATHWRNRPSLRSMVRPRCRRRSASIPRARNLCARPAKDPLHQELLHKRIAELKARMPVGGLREATIRALLYVGGARSAVDERGFEIVRRIRRELARVGRSCRCRNSRRWCASSSSCC